MTKKFNLYLGKAGQLAIMSYFLARGWNVAMPEVDVGDDLFVVEDKKGIFYRVQVKTAQAIERQNGYSSQFNVPLAQLQTRIDPEIYFVFMIYLNDEWSDKIIIPRSNLFEIFNDSKFGSISGENLIVYFSFQNNKILCSGVDLSEFRNNFENFPIIEH